MALYISFLLNCFRKNDKVLDVLHEMSVDCGPLPSLFSSEWVSQTEDLLARRACARRDPRELHFYVD